MLSKRNSNHAEVFVYHDQQLNDAIRHDLCFPSFIFTLLDIRHSISIEQSIGA